jgi:type I restriction-modification system, M subunit
MTNTKKEQERAALHATIWKIADSLRGSVSGWDFQKYILGMLFYRFISENIIHYINTAEHEAGNDDFDYSKLDDKTAEFAREEAIKDK